MFLTGTRADFGHQKPLIDKCIEEGYDVSIFVTGMHLDDKYGYTYDEIDEYGYRNLRLYKNYLDCRGIRFNGMDNMLASTVQGFSSYVKDISPDLIVIFADRFEALAGAIVGALNNILTLHVQAGDVSGTIDDSMRHAISKLCHAHCSANGQAKKRLINMGEIEENISVIGTPGLDVLLSEDLPILVESQLKYDFHFDKYGILIFHPVTTEVDDLSDQVGEVVSAVIKSGLNYIVVCPNNDLGSDKIFKSYNRFAYMTNIKVFESIDHYDFLTFLKNARFIIGNSSCGILEAPCYGNPAVNIGSRQDGRSRDRRIFNCDCNEKDILKNIEYVNKTTFNPNGDADGHCADRFIEMLSKDNFWDIGKQKKFKICT